MYHSEIKINRRKCILKSQTFCKEIWWKLGDNENSFVFFIMSYHIERRKAYVYIHFLFYFPSSFNNNFTVNIVDSRSGKEHQRKLLNVAKDEISNRNISVKYSGS